MTAEEILPATKVEENITRVREGFDAFAAGDYAALADLFTDDVIWHNHGRNVLSGEFSGKTHFFGMMARMLEMTGGPARGRRI